jgi:hypothetical protein
VICCLKFTSLSLRLRLAKYRNNGKSFVQNALENLPSFVVYTFSQWTSLRFAASIQTWVLLAGYGGIG